MGNDNKPKIRFKGFTDAWEQRKLGEQMIVTSVKRILQSDWTDAGVRFLRARDIVSASKNEEPADYLYISKEKYDEYSALSGKVSIGDMLVTGVGTIGVPYLINNSEPVYFKDGNIIWFQNERKIDSEFFYYSFYGKQIQSFIKDSAGIGTVGTYTIESGKKTPISLPSKAEQERIGTFFRNLDNLITLHQRKCDKLQNVKKSMLEKMFPKNGASVPEIRFKGFTDAWEQRKVGEVADFFDEQRKPLESGVRESGIYPYYGASGIIDYVKDYLFDEERILLSEDGANIIDRNYRVCFLARGKYWVNNHAHVLKAKDNYDNGFICEALEKINYESYNTGTAQPKLNQEVCRSLEIMLPNYAEQIKISALTQRLDNLITLHQRELTKLQNIKKSCLEKMFV